MKEQTHLILQLVFFYCIFFRISHEVFNSDNLFRLRIHADLTDLVAFVFTSSRPRRQRPLCEKQPSRQPPLR